jgi:succinoglycan biosynthesis transport protein ExoP
VEHLLPVVPSLSGSASFDDRRDEDASGNSQASELLEVSIRHWRLFVILLLAFFGAGTAIVLLQQKYYTSDTSVLFDPRNRQIVNFTPVVDGFGAALEVEVATELQLILSRRVTDPVISQFDLLNDPEFNRVKPGLLDTMQAWVVEGWSSTPRNKLSGDASGVGRTPSTDSASAAEVRQAVLRTFAKRLKAQVQGQSTVIKISFTSEDPEKAAMIANAIAANYVQLSVTDKGEAVEHALETLTKRSAELRDQAVSAESAVEDYRTSAHLVEGSGGSVIAAQITEFNSELVQAEADLAAAQARSSQMEEMKGDPAGAPAVLASPVIQQLRQEEARQTGLLAGDQRRQGDRYPGVEGRKSALAALREQIDIETTNIMRGRHAEVDAAQARVNLLQVKLADIWGQARNNGTADVHLRQLKLEAGVQRALYESYLRRIQEISQQVGTAQPYAEVISAAEAHRKPSSPDLALLLPCILLVCAAMASFGVVCVEILSASFHSSRQIARVFSGHSIELIPRFSQRQRGLLAGARTLETEDSISIGPYAEAIQALRVHLRNLGSNNQSVLFSSAVAKEGKTATAVAVARQEARAGLKVLMIDADLRRPSLHHIFGGNNNGLSDLLLEHQTFDELVQLDRTSGLAYLAAGTRGSSPIDLLASAAMLRFLRYAEQRFDRIIIDSPPVLAVADARVLTALVSRTIYIVRWRSTPRGLARLGLEMLRQSGGQVLGPIFVQVDRANTPYSPLPQRHRLQS